MAGEYPTMELVPAVARPYRKKRSVWDYSDAAAVARLG